MNLASTISDGVLALSSLTMARALVAAAGSRAHRRALGGAALGLGLIGVAALSGSLHFAGFDALAGIHQALSDAATAISMPLIGCAAVTITWSHEWSERGWMRLLFALTALFAAVRYCTDAFALYGLAVGALGTSGALAGGTRGLARNQGGGLLVIVGAILVLIAGLAVGSEGELGPFARLDIFHYLLALANLCLGGGLLRLARGR